MIDNELPIVMEALRRLEERYGGFWFDVSYTDLFMIIATVQLSLPHPDIGQGVRRRMQSFVDATIAKIREKEPALADVLEKGNDPREDFRRGG